MALSPSTLKVYASTLKRVYGIDPAVPPKVEGTEVQPLPPGNYNEETTNSTRAIIRGAVRWWYSTADNPEIEALGTVVASKIPFRHEVKKRKRYPSSEEITAFWGALEQLPTPKKEMLAIPLLLGLRASEFLTLSREAVSQALQTGIITIQRKGSKEGELPVAKAKPYLKSLFGVPKRNLSGALNPQPWQTLWEIYAESQKGAYFAFRRLVESNAKASKATSEWTPHTLRHAFASEMIRAGAPLAVVQRALGHASYMTTVRTYVHIDTKDLEKWMDRADTAIKPPAVGPVEVVEVQPPVRIPVPVPVVEVAVPVVEVQAPKPVQVVEVPAPIPVEEVAAPASWPSGFGPRNRPVPKPVPVVRPRKVTP